MAVIPTQAKRNPKALLDALVDYIKRDSDGREKSDLLDFLNDESEEAVFELVFDQDQLLDRMNTYQESDGESYIPYQVIKEQIDEME